MKSKQLLIVLTVAAIALIVGSGILSNKAGEQEFERTGLFSDINWLAVNSITIEKNDKHVKIDKLLEQWQVTSKDGYPVDLGKLSTLLQALKDAEIVELKTKLAKNYHRLGLDFVLTKESADAKNGAGTLLTLQVADKKHQLVIGNTATKSNGSYVRFLSKPQSYLIDQNLNPSTDGKEWINAQILDISFDQTSQIEVAFEAGHSFTIHRPKSKVETEEEQGTESENVKVTDLPKLVDEVTELGKNKPVKLEQDFVLKSASNPSEFEQRELQYSTILSGLTRNILNIEATDTMLTTDTVLTNAVKVASYRLTYRVDGEEKVSSFDMYKKEAAAENLSSEKDAEKETTSQYFVKLADSKYLLTISDFDFKQITKPLTEYFEDDNTDDAE